MPFEGSPTHDDIPGFEDTERQRFHQMGQALNLIWRSETVNRFKPGSSIERNASMASR